MGGGSSGGRQWDQMAGDGDQWREKEVATDARTLDMDDGSSLSSTDIGVCFLCFFMISRVCVCLYIFESCFCPIPLPRLW